MDSSITNLRFFDKHVYMGAFNHRQLQPSFESYSKTTVICLVRHLDAES